MGRQSLYITEAKGTILNIVGNFKPDNLPILTKPLKMASVSTNLSGDINLDCPEQLDVVVGVSTLIKGTATKVNAQKSNGEETILDQVSVLTGIIADIGRNNNRKL